MLDPNRHNDIKRRLRECGSSITQIARDIGKDQSTVTIVSQGHRKSDPIQRAIAERLGTTAEALFPERYKEESE